MSPMWGTATANDGNLRILSRSRKCFLRLLYVTMTKTSDPITRPSRKTWWRTGLGLMILGLLVGFVLSWSGLVLDWIFDVKEGSYVMFTTPVGILIGLGFFVTGLVFSIVAAVRRWRVPVVKK